MWNWCNAEVILATSWQGLHRNKLANIQSTKLGPCWRLRGTLLAKIRPCICANEFYPPCVSLSSIFVPKEHGQRSLQNSNTHVVYGESTKSASIFYVLFSQWQCFCEYYAVTAHDASFTMWSMVKRVSPISCTGICNDDICSCKRTLSCTLFGVLNDGWPAYYS